MKDEYFRIQSFRALCVNLCSLCVKETHESRINALTNKLTASPHRHNEIPIFADYQKLRL